MPTPLPHMKTLIIDPKPHGVQLLRSILSMLGLADIVATDTSEGALTHLREHRFDVVFCDEAMKPMNPVAFSKAVRRDSSGKNATVPIVVMTGSARKRQVELARDSGANHVIVRPMSMATVRRKLESLLFAAPVFVQSDAFCGPDRRREGRRTKASGGPPKKDEERRETRGRRRTDKAAAEAAAKPTEDTFL